MGNIDPYDEKVTYDQRYRSQHSKSTSFSSNSSNASSNSCSDEKFVFCTVNAHPYSSPFQHAANGRRSEGAKGVRFMVEKPLPPGWVMNWNWEVERKGGSGNEEKKEDRKRTRREKEEEWWRSGGQGLVPYDSDEEDDDDGDEQREI
jgi:hypothetical protein